MSTPETTETSQEQPVNALEAPPEPAQEAETQQPSEPEQTIDPQIKRLRDENAKWRLQVREQEERVKALEREKMTEADRVKAERDEAVQQLAAAREQARIESLTSQAVRVGAQMGLNDPDDAIRLIPASAITYDPETGQPNNVADLVQQLITDKPYLAKQATRRPDAGLVPGGQQTGAHQIPQKEETLAERRARLATGGRPGGADGLDLSNIASRGGGVWMGGKNLLTGEREPDGSAA